MVMIGEDDVNKKEREERGERGKTSAGVSHRFDRQNVKVALRGVGNFFVTILDLF